MSAIWACCLERKCIYEVYVEKRKNTLKSCWEQLFNVLNLGYAKHIPITRVYFSISVMKNQEFASKKVKQNFKFSITEVKLLNDKRKI